MGLGTSPKILVNRFDWIDIAQYNFLYINKYQKILYFGNVDILNNIGLKIGYDNLYYVNIEQMSIPSYFKILKKIKDKVIIFV